MVDGDNAVERRFQNGVAPRLVLALNPFQLLMFPPEMGRPKLALNHRNQPRKIFLRDIIRGAGPDHNDGILLPDGSRNDDKRNIRPSLLQNAQRLETAKARHRVVRQDNVPGMCRERRAE